MIRSFGIGESAFDELRFDFGRGCTKLQVDNRHKGVPNLTSMSDADVDERYTRVLATGIPSTQLISLVLAYVLPSPFYTVFA